MLEEKQVIVEETEQVNPVLSTVRTLFLAGLGAVMMLQDEAGKLVDKMVERGEERSKEGRKQVNQFVEARKKNVEKVGKKAETQVNKQIERTLHRLNIPTRNEITTLGAKITRLSKKVEDLNKVAA